MGKGGSMTVKTRSSLAETIPQPYEKITKRTLREAIPAKFFVRSYAHSFRVLAQDVAEAAAAWVIALYLSNIAPSYCAPLIWAAYWMYQGLTFTGLWVIAHECGHGGFTDSRTVNDVVGWCVHSFLMTPYFSWAFTHAKHHHYTNHMTMGETWVPSTANPEKASVKFAKTTLGTMRRIVVVALIGWYSYLISNETGAKQNKGQSHFSPASKALFKAKDALYVHASNFGMLLMGALLCASIWQWGMWAFVRGYLIPQTICNFYLCSITYMQHTHSDVPHFNAEQWTWLRGALSTIDRSMGTFVDKKLHHIVDSHVVHHIFSDMPFYGAKAATPYVKEHLGVYYKSHFGTKVAGSEYLGYWKDYFNCMKTAVSVQPGEQDFLWFR